ncbi:putative reverse transcriptase domain-containing protein [Tanacetum coccineum]
MPKSSSGYDTIWVQSVDKTEPKSVIFLPIREDYKTEKLAKIYVNEIVARHGVPVSIISDRDGRFTSHLWQALQEALGTRLDMSTAYHPQTDGSDVNSIFRAGGYASSISPVIWTEVGESQLIGPEIVQETTEKIFNQGKMKTAEVARKSYADKWDVSLLNFEVGGTECYMKVFFLEGSDWENLRFVEEPLEIVERDVKKLKRRRIPLVKVCWNSRQGAEYTWEREDQFRKKYPHLFSEPVPSSNVAT